MSFRGRRAGDRRLPSRPFWTGGFIRSADMRPRQVVRPGQWVRTAVCLVIHSITAQPRPAGQGRKACRRACPAAGCDLYLHARQLPDLAPAPGLGTADLHRPESASPGKPRRPRPLRRRPGQGVIPARPGRPPLPQLRRPARPPGHPHPQPGPFTGTRATTDIPTEPTWGTAAGIRTDRGRYPAHL